MNQKLLLCAFAGCLALPLSSPVQAQTPTLKPTAPAPAKPAANGPAGVAAEVNGEKILLADLNRMLASVKDTEPSLQQNTPTVQKALNEIRSQLLEEMIATRVLAQEAKKRRINVAPAEIERYISELRKGFKTEAEFVNWLKEDGKTVEDLKRTINDELAIRELTLQLTAEVSVSNEDIAKYYRENVDLFTIPEMMEVRHILLAINANAPKEEKDRVKQRATGLIAQLNKGADFAALAKNNSDDPLTKNNGGSLGRVARNQLNKALETAAFAAQVGKIVGPVESGVGIHVVKVEKKIPAEVVPLSKVQSDPRIRTILRKQKVEKKIEDSTNQFKAASQIKRYA